MMKSFPQGVIKAIEAEVQRAYRQGWDDAIAMLIEAAPAKGSRGDTSLAEAKVSSDRNDSIQSRMAELNDRVTAREAVTQALAARPGMLAMEVHRWIEAKGPSISFDAIRQAIMRMRRAGIVVRHKNGYALAPSFVASAKDSV